jgi:hypothetical protein
MIRNIFLVFSVLLLVGLIVPAYAQTADHVVINEVDINPTGDDSKSISEWVEIYNPAESTVDLSNWEIASTTVLKKTLTLPSGTVILPGGFLKFSYTTIWFTDSNESVELRDESGVVVDKTPMFSDLANDFSSWQRLYDGYNFNDSEKDWKFVSSTAGSTNGKLVEIVDSESVTVSAVSEKSSYLFGQYAVIRGHVSEEVYIVKPYFQPEPIMVSISGPNFDRTLTLYPDLNLNYDATLSLQQVLGINAGTYDVSVNYAGATANTSFSVGYEIIEQDEKIDGSFGVVTDQAQYLPGQTVSIIGFATEIIPFQGLTFTVTDSQGVMISNGNLFPTDGEFKTSLFITTINPPLGTYDIIADYSDKSTSTTFEVIGDIKESVPISLWTDKEFYGLGDTVNITGRLNDHWVDSLDLEILQTKSLSLGVDEQAGGGSVLKILDAVRPDGDSKFSYSFTIPISDSRLGDYLININKDVGSVTKIIKVVPNPETYVLNTEPLVITTDQSSYDFSSNNKVVVSGQILDPVTRTSLETSVVKITISTSDGSPLEIIGLPEGGKRLSTGGISVGYEFTAIPEVGGAFTMNTDLNRLIFSEGTYTIEAQYQSLLATTSFEIIDHLDLGSTDINASLDKSVYGLGETVNLSGIFSSQTRDSQGITITLYKPDGDTDKFGTVIDSGFFSWTWIAPIYEKSVTVERDRSITPTNFGIYKINLETGEGLETDVFFKLSSDPDNDELTIPPLSVSTSKLLYKAGDELFVEGTVNERIQGTEGLVVPERVWIKIVDGTFPFKQIHESFVYPTSDGTFFSTFELPATIFSEGSYNVKVVYDGFHSESTFSVANDFIFGIDDPVSLLVVADKSEYNPGDTVVISGKPNKLIYLEAYDVSIIKKDSVEINCGSFICGTNAGPITAIQPGPSGSFVYQYKIPDNESSIGLYEASVDANFETKYVPFTVVEKPLPVKLDVVVEKQNRIPEKMILVSAEEKFIDSTSVAPRVITGSLITPIRSDESMVNLKVSSISGICIIGPDADCLVSESTRKPGQIYDVVEVDGMSLNVRYSGPDVRLEKFSILPESSTEFLPNADWNVEVIKDEQVSRFYYKVTYKTLE